MQLGVTLPQLEISSDPAVLREYTQTAEELGYSYLTAYDHVVGADLTGRPDWRGPYNLHSHFHEVFVMLGFVAAVTERLGLATGVLILPQRQTVLVAKQAAEVDVLSGGRFRLGVGLGWNQVEYEALNERFSNRGRRSEEQIQLLRLLFTEESVTFIGRWHSVPAAGLNPLPVQRPIPIWLGGSTDATLRRIAALGDGWMINLPPDDRTRGMVDQLRRYSEEAGRDPASIGLEGRISIAGSETDEWRRQLQHWQELGATHCAVNTMRAGLESPRAHIEAIPRFNQAVG